jgi:hypothetical protein
MQEMTRTFCAVFNTFFGDTVRDIHTGEQIAIRN